MCDTTDMPSPVREKRFHVSLTTDNGDPVKVLLYKDTIMIGCSSISLAALRYLLSRHEEAFPRVVEPIVLQ